MKLFRILPVALTALILAAPNAGAYQKRDILLKSINLNDVKSSIIPNGEWLPYPAYDDREGWDEFLGDQKETLIEQGEKLLDYQWKLIKATDYLEFTRSGSRSHVDTPNSQNSTALANLFMAELAEGKGRFIDQIINGAWAVCEKTVWASSAHLYLQSSKVAFPDHRENIIDLVGANEGSLLAWINFYLRPVMDEVQPLVGERIEYELRRRMLDTYMERNDLWWQGFDRDTTETLNNWNPWCNGKVLECFLLVENDPEKLAEGVYKTITSVNLYLNYLQEDGACEEGPAYWGQAAGRLFDYLEVLSLATGSKINFMEDPMIKRMGEYIVKAYVGDGWVANFADCKARNVLIPQIIYSYGKAAGSELMQNFAAQTYNGGSMGGNDILRRLRAIQTAKELANADAEVEYGPWDWYPDTEVCFIRQEGVNFAAKSGYNSESHNHNDVGTFSLWSNSVPMFIDAGVGTYTRQTFNNSERYKIWTMQSGYHNLPQINGIDQSFGYEYRGKDVKFDPGALCFSVDIAGAYPEEAQVQKWVRSYTLKGRTLKITDNFKLTAATGSSKVNFLTWGEPDVSESGKVSIEKDGSKVLLSYDKKLFDASVEEVVLVDPALIRVWGEKVYRLTLTARRKPLSATWTYNIEVL